MLSVSNFGVSMPRVLNFADSFSSASSPSATAGIAYTVYATQTISDGGTIDSTDPGLQLRRIQGDATGVTLATAPFGVDAANFSDGQIVTLQGVNDTNTITITNQDITEGAILNGDMELIKGSMLELVYDENESRWYEKSRKELA